MADIPHLPDEEIQDWAKIAAFDRLVIVSGPAWSPSSKIAWAHEVPGRLDYARKIQMTEQPPRDELREKAEEMVRKFIWSLYDHKEFLPEEDSRFQAIVTIALEYLGKKDG